MDGFNFREEVRKRRDQTEDATDRLLWSWANRNNTWMRIALVLLVAVGAGLAVGFGMGYITTDVACDCAG